MHSMWEEGAQDKLMQGGPRHEQICDSMTGGRKSRGQNERKGNISGGKGETGGKGRKTCRGGTLNILYNNVGGRTRKLHVWPELKQVVKKGP